MRVVEETRLGTWLTQPLVSIREALDNHQSLAPARTRSQVSWLVSATNTPNQRPKPQARVVGITGIRFQYRKE
jgi:hypothetical protein